MIDMSLTDDDATGGAHLPSSDLRGAVIRATDGERLMRFRRHRDEAAFREVVEAHAGLVWGICWQVLRHREDVEDAFQATFLILARKANSIRAADSAAGWLYRVAFRTALAARQRRRRLGVEPLAVDPPATLEDQLASIERSEQCEALLEELHALADRYRQPLVLCYLEGRSRQEAAEELGVTAASVKGRLARGLRLLRTRLAHRGTAMSAAAALLASEMSAAQACAGAAPVAQTAALAATFAWPTLAATTTGGGPAATTGVFTLAKKGILAMKLATAAKPAIGLLALGLTAGALALAAGETPPGGGGRATTAVVELVADGGDGPLGDVTADAGDATVEVAGALLDVSNDAQPAIESAGATADAAVDVVADVVDTVDAPSVTFTNGGGDSPRGVTLYAPAGVAGPGQARLEVYPADAAGPVSIAPPGTLVLTTSSPQAPATTALPRTAPQLFDISTPSPLFTPTAAIASAGSSRESLQLEMQHWQLKAQGLEKKATALRLKAEQLKAGGEASRIDALEADAESDLAMAEVMLCKARSRQLKESLEHWGEQLAAPRPDGDVFYQQRPGGLREPPTAEVAVASVSAPSMTVAPSGALAAPSADSLNPPAIAPSPDMPAPPVAPAAVPPPPLAQPTAEPVRSSTFDYNALARSLDELRAANARLQKQIDELRAAGQRP